MENQNNGEFKRLRDMLFLYDSALKIVNTKIEILQEDYKNSEYNPIEQVKIRLKNTKSIYEKLKRKNLPLTLESAKENIEDIAGLRIICAFTEDIYELVSVIKKHTDIKLVKEADYIANPKPNGYRSYHMIIEVPVFIFRGVENVKVEIQIRTKPMDFWANLEQI